MTRSTRSSIGLAGLLALALAASAGAAQAQQSQPCTPSNDIGDFDDELRRDCGPVTYEADPNMDPRNHQRTVVMTPHQADYSSFPMTSLARFFDGLSYQEKLRVVQIAGQHGVSDGDNRPLSVEDFGAMTDFLDNKLDREFSPNEKRQFLGQLAADARVYGNGRDRTAGQDFGGGGPRYDYEVALPPRR